LHSRSPVDELCIEKDRIRSIRLRSGGTLDIDAVVSCVPPAVAAKWLPSNYGSQLICETSPIISMYIWHPPFLDDPFVGCCKSLPQWVFRKRDDLVQVTISSASASVLLSDDALIENVTRDLEILFPKFSRASLQRVRIVRERRATFRLASPVFPGPFVWPNFYLAGDWTNTGLPPTIESACRSAERVQSMLTN